eukprot:scaffold149119_cov63-Attheya_sp.AAC.1
MKKEEEAFRDTAALSLWLLTNEDHVDISIGEMYRDGFDLPVCDEQSQSRQLSSGVQQTICYHTSRVPKEPAIMYAGTGAFADALVIYIVVDYGEYMLMGDKKEILRNMEGIIFHQFPYSKSANNNSKHNGPKDDGTPVSTKHFNLFGNTPAKRASIWNN